MTTPSEVPRWVTRSQAAEIANVHVRTVDNMLTDGRLTKHKNGFGRVLIDRFELERHMEPRSVPQVLR